MAEIASGSIDLKSLKVAGEPNKYITYITNEGIRIHDANSSTTNFVKINSNGMQIYKGGTADNNKVAQFGSTINLYKPGTTDSLVTIDSNGASFTGTVIANAGSIGGWNISTDSTKSLYYGGSSTTPTPGSGVIVLSKGLTATTSIAGSTGQQTWTITAGNKFGVTTDGTLYANGANITNINGANITGNTIAVGAMTSGAQEQILNSNIKVGGRNLVWDTEWKDVTNRWSNWGSPTTREIVTVNGKRWMHIVTTTTAFEGYSQNKSKRNNANEVVVGDKVVCSFTAYAATAGQEGCIGIHWLNSSGSIVGQNWTKHSFTTSEKRYVSDVFTVPDGTVSFNIMVGDNTTSAQEMWFSQVQLEFGNMVTSWSPAPEDVAATATNYITNIDSNKGITVKPQDSSGNDFLQMNSTAIEFFRNSTTTSVMRLTDNSFRLGLEAANHTTIDTNGLHIWAGTESTTTNEVALFSSTARIGRTNNSRFLINAGSLQAYNSSNAEYFEVSSTNLSFANNYGYLFKINKKANDTIDMQLATPSTNETNGYDVFKVSTRIPNQTIGTYYFPYPYTLGTTVDWFLPPGFKFNDWIQVYNVQGEIITSYATYTTSTWAGRVKISLTLSTSYSGPLPQQADIAYIVPASSNLLTGTGALYNWQVPFTIGNGSTNEYGELATSHNAMIVDIYGNILSSGMAGQIIMYAGERAPIGWLLCQGQAVSRTTYATLFAVIGTTYGTGNGSTTFNLPDFRGRVGVGVGTGTATGATAHTLNQKAGEETHVLTPGETAMKQHEHDLKYNVVEWKNGTTSTNKSCRNIVASGTGTTTTEKTTAANGSAHNNMQPYIGINYIICTGETDYSKLVD